MPTEAQLAELTQQFLSRVDFKGAEVHALVQVINWLESKKEPKAEQDKVQAS
jgi:hypothetical protein